ncbi:M56 family metallopeptidase [Stieleria mannarensis]|uniref:M56 family metallopeptidase n=1 Tax=Stieleria mannarensis TaxID=2755585 RepID=UPI001601F989|nr:M56 family metallopeptidase [Rhodopirellula sp. JC639]
MFAFALHPLDSVWISSAIVLSCFWIGSLLHRSPERRQRCCEAGIVIALVVAALVFVPLPRAAPFQAAPRSQTLSAETVVRVAPTASSTQQNLATPLVDTHESAAADAVVPSAVSTKPVKAIPAPIRWRAVLIGAYFMGAGLCAAFLLVGRLRLRWIEAVAREERSGDLPPHIRLLISPRARRPYCYGIFRPRIVMPPAVAKSPHCQHVIRHEMVHLQRCDGFTRMLINLAMPVLYLHPFYWLLRRSAIMASEHVADTIAAQTSSIDAYSTGMIELSRSLHTPPLLLSVVGGWSNPSTLTKRIEWLFQSDRKTHPCTLRWSCMTGSFAIALLGFVTVLFGVAPQNAQSGVLEAVGDPIAGSIWSMTPDLPGSAARIRDCDVEHVRGQVVDDGMPVAGADVWASGFGRIGGREKVVTDQDGRFELSLPIDPRMAIRSWTIAAFQGDRFGRSGTVDDDGKVTIDLDPGRVAEFEVRDRASGDLISAARLFLQDGRIVDASDGRCRVGGLAKDLVRMVVVAPGFARRAIEIDLYSEDQTPLVVHLDKGGRIHGRILDRSGQPVAGNPVGLMVGHQSLQPAMQQITDDNGSYSLSGIPVDQPVRLSAYSHKTAGGSRWETQTVSVDAADLLEVNFAVDGDHAAPPETHSPGIRALSSDRPDPGRGAVRGQVLLPSGEPAQEFELSYHWPRDWKPGEEIISGGRVGNACLFTPADGRFEFTGLQKGGTYRLVAASPGYQDAVVSRVHAVAVDQLESAPPIKLQFKPATDAVVMVDDAGEQPVAGADVWLVPDHPKRPLDADKFDRRRLHGKTDSRGQVRFSNVPFADGVLIVEKEGKGTKQVPWDGTNAAVRLLNSASLKIQLARPTGIAKPVTVFLQRNGSNRLTAKVAGSGDRFVLFENLTSATYKLSIESDDYRLGNGKWQQEIGRVKPGKQTVVTLMLREASSGR